MSAQYVDIGSDGHFAINSKIYANGFIIDARKSNIDKLGIGYGYQEKGLEGFVGIGYTSNDAVYYFGELVYKNERHSIYDLSVDYVTEKPELSLGYTHLVSENFGIIGKLNFTSNVLFLGVRKWL